MYKKFAFQGDLQQRLSRKYVGISNVCSTNSWMKWKVEIQMKMIKEKQTLPLSDGGFK